METGPADQVCSDPSHPYTQALLAAETIPGLGSTPGPATVATTGVDEGAGSALVLPQRDVQTGGAAAGCPYYGRCPLSIERCRDDRPLLHPIGRSTVAACHLLPDRRPCTRQSNRFPQPTAQQPAATGDKERRRHECTSTTIGDASTNEPIAVPSSPAWPGWRSRLPRAEVRRRLHIIRIRAQRQRPEHRARTAHPRPAPARSPEATP